MPCKAESGSRAARATQGDSASPASASESVADILDTVDVPIVVVGRDCKVTRFNRAAADTLGVAPTDIGRRSCDLQALAGAPGIEDMCVHAIADGVASRCELRSGDRRFLVRIAPYPESGAALRGAVLTFTNVTAFQASLAQAIYEREYTKTILNAVIDPLVVLDESLQVQTANRAFYDRFGVSREQAQGVFLGNLGDDAWKASDLWSALTATLLNGREFTTVEIERDFANLGRRTVLVDARRLARDGKAVAVVSFRDITEHKRAVQSARREIESRERAEATLREVDRRKDEFLATLAHELRNPLGPIRQASAVSRAASATEEQKRWSHEVIDRQVRHMGLLLDDLLDIARVTRGTLELRPQTTDLTAIIAAATEAARPVIEAKRHALKIEIQDEPARFAADPLRLAQVLSNLLTNAAKYTDPEGEIRLRGMCSADTVTFSVADNGIGIHPDAHEEVFAMFSQVKSTQDRSEGGLGIGLALARGLVHLHRGTLDLRSEGMGRGSEFIVRLPRATLRGVPDAPAAVAFGLSVRRRVLIADDNRDSADSLAMLMQMDGHDVTVVNDGGQALATIDAFRPEIAVLDIGMPGLNGYEVARKVRQSSLGNVIALIAVTGFGQASDKARAAAAGFDHHLTKPIDPDTLAQIIRSEPVARKVRGTAEG